MTFPHKLFMDYLAAWHICRFTQNIQESLKQAFPAWDDVWKHEEVVRACCGLMKGREEVIMHVISVVKVRLMQETLDFYSYYGTASSLQNECGIQTPLFVEYPACGHPLSQVLNTAKLVLITDLTGEEYDDDLPCNADIVIATNDQAKANSGVMRTLQRHRDHIIAIGLDNENQDVMKQMGSLLPSSSLGRLSLAFCYVQKEIVNSLSEMPQLTHLTMYTSEPEGRGNSLASHGDLLLAAIKAWNGHSKLQILDLGWNFLPVSVSRPLLVAIAANCPHLEVLDMKRNTLSGCLAGFMQNPPPALRTLKLMKTHLQAEDMESMIAAVTAGKLQHLNKLELNGNRLSEAAMAQLLHALLNTLGGRKLTLYVGGVVDFYGITIAPSDHKSVDHYLQQIRHALQKISLPDYSDPDTSSDYSDFDLD